MKDNNGFPLAGLLLSSACTVGVIQLLRSTLNKLERAVDANKKKNNYNNNKDEQQNNHADKDEQPVHNYVWKLGFRESDVAKALRFRTTNPTTTKNGQQERNHNVEKSRRRQRQQCCCDPAEASLFRVLLPAMGAKRVLQVGIDTGYNTLALAESVCGGQQQRVVALAHSEEEVSVGEPSWIEARVRNRIELHVGPVVPSLRKLLQQQQHQDGTYDFCLLMIDDAASTTTETTSGQENHHQQQQQQQQQQLHYYYCYELLLQLLRPNAIMAITNVLLDGNVLDPNQSDETTEAVRDLSVHIYNDDRIEHVLLPLTNGVTLLRKRECY